MSYGDDSGFTAWLTAHGYTLSGDVTAAVLRARGSAYLDGTYEAHWSGRRTDGVSQENGWPRTGAKLHCSTAIEDDAVPLAVVNASYRAAYIEDATPGILAGSSVSGQRVRRQKVDVIEREFFDDGGASAGSGGPAFIDAEIDGAMRAFICKGSAFLFDSIGS